MRILALLLVALWSVAAAAQDAAPAPCRPSEISPAGSVRVWSNGAPEAESWLPPTCTGWTTPGFKSLVAVTGGFAFSGGADALLARFGAISGLAGVQFWSPSEDDWRPLAEKAAALAAPAANQRRPDFSPEELKRGGEHFFLQGGGRTGDVVYRMRIVEASPERIVVTTENATPVKIMMLTLFPPGELQSVYILDRHGPGQWSYANLTRTGRNASSLTEGRDASIVNRAVALGRHFTGTELVRDPGPAVSRR